MFTGGSVRGSVDSNYDINVLAEEPLSDMMMLSLCGHVNVPKNVYDFGLGVQLTV